VFLNMFLSSIRPLWNRRLCPGGGFVLGAMCYLFISATANIAINIATGYDTFSMAPNNAGPSNEYSLKTILSGWFCMLGIWTAESTLIWRLWAVWSRSWRIVAFPIALLCIEIGSFLVLCGRTGLHQVLEYPHQNHYEIEEIISSVSFLLINLICSPLVIVRLWWVGRRVQTNQTRSLYRTVTY
ncbi:hypothetical protein FRB95_001822, partial [Tulasnella sp. JGI-2019a]